jgi:hypothetical protein
MTTYSLAQVIQAEAATPEGQFAVASTIFNRTNAGTFGGSDPLSVANAPGQFAGHLISPTGPGAVPTTVSPFAQQLGDALQGGTLSNFGNTGNALFFQSNQGQPSTVVGGASVNIGGNFFSDRSGQPSTNFQAPVFGGTTSPTTSGPSENPAVDVGAAGGTGDSMTMGGTAPNNGDITNIPVQGVNAPFDNPITPNANAGSGASAGNAPKSGATDSGGGAPIQITDATKIASQAGDTVSKALGGVTSGVAADTQSVESTGTGWLNSIFSGGTSLLVRGGLIMVGLFLLLGAFVFFYVDSKTSSD